MVLSPIQKTFVYIPKQPWSFILCSQSTWRYWPVNTKPGGRSQSCIHMAPSIYKLKTTLLFTLPKCSTELLVFPLRERWSKYGTGGNKNDQLARPDRRPSGFPKWLHFQAERKHHSNPALSWVVGGEATVPTRSTTANSRTWKPKCNSVCARRMI